MKTIKIKIENTQEFQIKVEDGNIHPPQSPLGILKTIICKQNILKEFNKI